MPRRNGPITLTGASLGGSLVSLVWMLLCVVVIIVLAYLFTKYVAGRGGLGTLGISGGTDRFKVLCRLSLGRDQSAVLIQAGERYLLLGAAPSGVTLLAEFSQEEAQALYVRPDHQPAPPNFGQALRDVLKQRKPR